MLDAKASGKLFCEKKIIVYMRTRKGDYVDEKANAQFASIGDFAFCMLFFVGGLFSCCCYLFWLMVFLTRYNINP